MKDCFEITSFKFELLETSLALQDYTVTQEAGGLTIWVMTPSELGISLALEYQLQTANGTNVGELSRWRGLWRGGTRSRWWGLKKAFAK